MKYGTACFFFLPEAETMREAGRFEKI